MFLFCFVLLFHSGLVWFFGLLMMEEFLGVGLLLFDPVTLISMHCFHEKNVMGFWASEIIVLAKTLVPVCFISPGIPAAVFSQKGWELGEFNEILVCLWH